MMKLSLSSQMQKMHTHVTPVQVAASYGEKARPSRTGASDACQLKTYQGNIEVADYPRYQATLNGAVPSEAHCVDLLSLCYGIY